MLKITKKQWETLGRATYDRYIAKTSSEIEEKMRLRIPDTLKNYNQEQLSPDIKEALTAADQYCIEDKEQLYDWCVIRIVSGQKFYQMNEFKDILEHRFLTSFAKARHLILIFFTIVDMQMKGQSCAQR